MSKELNEGLEIAMYLEAAQRISDELTARGFTTDNLDSAQGLIDKMADIIRGTIKECTNYSNVENGMTQEDWNSLFEEMRHE